MMKNECLQLYAVTDRAWLNGRLFEEVVREALEGGATMIQLREKNLSKEAFIEEAKKIKVLTDQYHVPLIINDDIEVCLAVDADGVHVGQSDMAAADVRKLIGEKRILGVTAKTIEQAGEAAKAGADYIGSGAVFGTKTKQDAKNMSIEQLKDIVAASTIPVVAIGGITKENIMQLEGIGLAGAAVVSGIFAAENILLETKQLFELTKYIIEK